ncbi:hypothetical protein [Burkholderia sp. LS-044]|uniref:hypothetical protein n=1 Tax=Burkholderia sp. LS-044 TaxID=1459967 RepID=UPI00145606E6|nr:hypothetical protein [Burkholderia sp. LS-044]
MLKNKAGFWKTSFLIYGLTLNPHEADDARMQASPDIESHEDSPESKSPAKRQHFAGLGQNRNPTGLRQSPVNRPGQYVDATPVKRTGAA